MFRAQTMSVFATSLGPLSNPCPARHSKGAMDLQSLGGKLIRRGSATVHLAAAKFEAANFHF